MQSVSNVVAKRPRAGVAKAAGFRKVNRPVFRKGSTPGTTSGRLMFREEPPPGVLMIAVVTGTPPTSTGAAVMAPVELLR